MNASPFCSFNHTKAIPLTPAGSTDSAYRTKAATAAIMKLPIGTRPLATSEGSGEGAVVEPVGRCVSDSGSDSDPDWECDDVWCVTVPLIELEMVPLGMCVVMDAVVTMLPEPPAELVRDALVTAGEDEPPEEPLWAWARAARARAATANFILTVVLPFRFVLWSCNYFAFKYRFKK
jgi:hypothetical protein